MNIHRILGVVVACVVFLPATARAQSGITGQVRDTSGGILPGVTVEAASPALIEGRGSRSRTKRAATGSSICGPVATQ